jgi:hypothetical protein
MLLAPATGLAQGAPASSDSDHEVAQTTEPVQGGLAAGPTAYEPGQEAESAPSSRTPLRQGFNFSLGLGSASVGATCSACDMDLFDDRIGGLSGNVRIGASVTSRLVLAVEGMGWFNNSDDIYRRVASASVVLLGYPSETSSFFVKAGFGGIRGIVENDFLRVQTDGWSSQIGLGYDFPVGESVAVTAFGEYVYTIAPATWINGVSVDEAVSPNAFNVGLAITVQ